MWSLIIGVRRPSLSMLYKSVMTSGRIKNEFFMNTFKLMEWNYDSKVTLLFGLFNGQSKLHLLNVIQLRLWNKMQYIFFTWKWFFSLLMQVWNSYSGSKYGIISVISSHRRSGFSGQCIKLLSGNTRIESIDHLQCDGNLK